ncbi:YgjV family protein [Pseudoalteromonas sp. SA25]|uniref:YgjV family protein n=1 Tax=Pseudoalteromonas sp. SA25 TaxID=2686347 RepID=UPI0013FE0808
MIDLMLQVFPVIFGAISLFCNTKTKMVVVNLLTAASWVFAFGIYGAWAGALVSAISGGSSLYAALHKKELTTVRAIKIILLMLLTILTMDIYTGSINLISYLPLFAFSFYRYGELRMKEYGYRVCGIIGGILYITYALIINSWGVAIGEMLFVAANIFYIAKLNKRSALIKMKQK